MPRRKLKYWSVVVVGFVGFYLLVLHRTRLEIRPADITRIEYVRRDNWNYYTPVELQPKDRDVVIRELASARTPYVLFHPGGIQGWLRLYYADGTNQRILLCGTDLVLKEEGHVFYEPDVNLTALLDATVPRSTTTMSGP